MLWFRDRAASWCFLFLHFLRVVYVRLLIFFIFPGLSTWGQGFVSAVEARRDCWNETIPRTTIILAKFYKSPRANQVFETSIPASVASEGIAVLDIGSNSNVGTFVIPDSVPGFLLKTLFNNEIRNRLSAYGWAAALCYVREASRVFSSLSSQKFAILEDIGHERPCRTFYSNANLGGKVSGILQMNDEIGPPVFVFSIYDLSKNSIFTTDGYIRALTNFQTILGNLVGVSRREPQENVGSQQPQCNEDGCDFQYRLKFFVFLFFLFSGFLLVGWGLAWWNGIYSYPDGGSGEYLATLSFFIGVIVWVVGFVGLMRQIGNM